MPNDYGSMVRQLMMQPQLIGDVVKGPPNWFNQGLPVKGIDPLGEAMGQQGMAPGGSKWFGNYKPPTKTPSAKDSAQTSFGVPIPKNPDQYIIDRAMGRIPDPLSVGAVVSNKTQTPKYDALIGKLNNAGATMKQMDQRAMNQYSAWAHQFGVEPSKIQNIIKAAEQQGFGRDQFMFMLAKFKQDGEL